MTGERKIGRIAAVAVCVLVLVTGSSQGAINVTATLMNTLVDPNGTSLDQYQVDVTTSDPSSLPILTISFPQITDAVTHQVWPFAGALYEPTPLVTDLSGLTWDVAWNDFDTHLLQDLGAADVIGYVGAALTEMNDGSEVRYPGPFGFDPEVGLGTWGTATGSWAYDGAIAAVTNTRPLASVTVLSGAATSLSVRVDTAGAYEEFTVAIGIPEPSTLILASLGLVGLAVVGCRRKWQG